MSEAARALAPATTQLGLRRAIAADIDRMLALKSRLRLVPRGGRTTEGGFLLGVSRERYEALVAHANVVIMDDLATGALAGFAVTLPDPVLRASDVWARRDAIAWSGAPPIAEGARVGYFDQIACAPYAEHRRGAPALALKALLDLLATGHQHVFATVVREPLHNTAALELLRAVGARHVGALAEHHEDLGAMRSDVYHLDRSDPTAPAPWTDTAVGRRILASIARMSARRPA